MIKNEAIRVTQFVFENSENIPEDFYIDIMNLMKTYHNYGNNLPEVYKFLNKNENKIDKYIIFKIRDFLPDEPSIIWSYIISLTWVFYYIF